MTFFFFFKWWLLRKNCLKFSLLRDRDLKLPPLVPFSLSNSHSCSQQIHNLVISSRNIRGKGWVSVRSHCSKVKMNVKTRNEIFFYNWTSKITSFICFGKQIKLGPVHLAQLFAIHFHFWTMWDAISWWLFSVNLYLN